MSPLSQLGCTGDAHRDASADRESEAEPAFADLDGGVILSLECGTISDEPGLVLHEAETRFEGCLDGDTEARGYDPDIDSPFAIGIDAHDTDHFKAQNTVAEFRDGATTGEIEVYVAFDNGEDANAGADPGNAVACSEGVTEIEPNAATKRECFVMPGDR